MIRIQNATSLATLPVRGGESWHGILATQFWRALFTGIYFSAAFQQVFSGVFGLLDELTVLITVALMLMALASGQVAPGLRVMAIAILTAAVAFLAATLLVGYPARYGDGVTPVGMIFVLGGILNHMKLFLFTWLLLHLGQRGIFTVTRGYLGFLIGATLLGFVVNDLFQETFQQMFDLAGRERFGQVRVVGFHLSTVVGATLLSLLLVVKLQEGSTQGGIRSTIVTLITLAIAVYIFTISTTRSGFVLFLIGMVFVHASTARGVMLAMLGSFSVGLLMLAGAFDGLLQSDILLSSVEMMHGLLVEPNYRIPRSVIIFNAQQLAGDYFPFGVGVTYFASPYAENSPIYGMLGIANLHFVQNYNGVIDSNIGSILGEMGVFGIAVFAIILISIARYAFIAAGRRRLAFIMFLLVSVALNSLTSPVFFKGDWCIVYALLFHLAAFGDFLSRPSEIRDVEP